MMERKLYPKPRDFLADNGDFLQQNEALVQLNYGNASKNRDADCHPGLLFGRYEEDGRMMLLFGNTAPWNVCLNAPVGEPRSMQAAAELAQYLRDTGIEINGVNAREDLADAFMRAYGGPFRLRTAMDIMVLRKLTEPPKVPCTVCKATLDDLDLILGWMCEFTQEALHETTTPADHLERSRPRVEAGQTYLCFGPKGEPVSMAVATRDLPHGTSLGGVYTPPEHRGKGYCQNTVAALCREELAEGKEYCTLFVDKKNPISNRVYKKVGFEIKMDDFDYRLEK